jgi:hypothetical protein
MQHLMLLSEQWKNRHKTRYWELTPCDAPSSTGVQWPARNDMQERRPVDGPVMYFDLR